MYIIAVIRSRRILAVAAFAALAAWANVQAMACCVIATDAPAPDVAEIAASSAETPMAADHSCCPGGAPSQDPAAESAPSPISGNSAASDVPAGMPGCGMDAGGAASLCCESGEHAAVSAKTIVSVDAGMQIAAMASSHFALLPAASFAPRPVSSSPPDGSPPFLSYQRLLI